MAEQNRDGGPAERFVAAIALSAAATLLIGWLALLVSRSGVSPAILFPLAVGGAVGACQAVIFRRVNSAPRPVAAILIGLALGLFAVATEDFSGYREYLVEYAKARQGNPLASMAGSGGEWKPISFAEYLGAIVRRNPLGWSIDVALTMTAAGGAAWAGGRKPKAGQTGDAAVSP